MLWLKLFFLCWTEKISLQILYLNRCVTFILFTQHNNVMLEVTASSEHKQKNSVRRRTARSPSFRLKQGLIRLIIRIRTFSQVLISTLTYWHLRWRVFMSLELEMCWLDCVCSKFFSCEKIRTFWQVPAEEPCRRANLTDLIGFHWQTRPLTVTPIKQFKLFFVLTSSDEYNNVTWAARSEVPRSSTQTKIKKENGL